MSLFLITGATGFVGRHVVRHAIAEGHEVVAITRGGAPDIGVTSSSLRFLSIPLSGERFSEAIAATPPDACIHLAWPAKPPDYLHDRWANLTALADTCNLVVALNAVGCGRIVISGTCLEPLAMADRADASVPIYARAKAALHELMAAAASDDMSWACAHLFQVYGPHEHPDRIVPLIINELLSGRTVEVTAGTQVRDFVHVVDVARALVTIATSGHRGAIDVCTGHPVQLREAFETVELLFESSGSVHHGARPTRPGEPASLTGDPTALHALGWEPRFDLTRGLMDAVEWWRAQMEDRPTDG